MLKIHYEYSQCHIIKGAGHAESRQILGKEKYQDIIKNFLKEINK
ncbi:hypothetical protein [uncultured Parvimonas sp.]|nr:hypothetical protein [uncultured Parvimonas sp.]